MKRRPPHRELRGLLPEVALGVAPPDHRAAVLEHVVSCAECRRDLERLSATADTVLLLGPERQPPPGFESRVLERLGGSPRRPRRRGVWRRAFQLAAAALIGAIAVLASYSAATLDDVQLGRLYAFTLRQGDGVALVVLPIVDADGNPAGRLYAYEGTPSWVLVTLTAAKPGGEYSVVVDAKNGKRFTMGSFHVDAGEGSFGKTLPIRFFDVARVRVTGPGGRLVAAVPSFESLLPL